MHSTKPFPTSVMESISHLTVKLPHCNVSKYEVGGVLVILNHQKVPQGTFKVCYKICKASQQSGKAPSPCWRGYPHRTTSWDDLGALCHWKWDESWCSDTPPCHTSQAPSLHQFCFPLSSSTDGFSSSTVPKTTHLSLLAPHQPSKSNWLNTGANKSQKQHKTHSCRYVLLPLSC